MIFEGRFKTKHNNEDCIIIIQTNDGDDTTVYINEDGGDIYFNFSDPVIISQQSEIFDTIQCTSCTINLFVKTYIGDKFFTGNSRDIIVNIYRGNKLLFAGFVEPNVYSQPFSQVYDQLQLTATCPLATLQYYTYNNILADEDFQDYKKQAKNKTLGDIIANILTSIESLDLVNNTANHVYYDGSIRLNSTSTLQTDIFTDVEISELLFLGESFDDIYLEHDVLHEILQYFDLKIRCEGNSFFIYSLSTVYDRHNINWYPMFTDIFYSIEQSSYARVRKGEYREKLVSSSDEDDYVVGNNLESSLSDQIYQVNINSKPAYVRYYQVTTPNGTVVQTDDFEYADIELLYEYFYNDVDYYIFNQNENGDYTLTTLAPDQAINEDGSIKYPEDTFDRIEAEYIIIEN